MDNIILKKEDFNENTTFKQVLNFNFSTHILFRCIPKKYANSFVKGKFRFGQPKAWIKMEQQGNKGQGDFLEGVCLATSKKDNSKFISNMKKNENIDHFEKSKLLYFRNKRINNLYCLCLYGLNSNVFLNKETDRFGKEHFIARVDKKYFMDFSPGLIEKQYFAMEEEERPVVLFINNPHMFFKKIKDFFVNLGVDEKDIIISPVEYVNLRKEFVSFLPHPYELFLKDEDFSNQSEVRIVINSDSEELINYMNENNNIIDIGNIEEIVTIYDYYFHDLLLEKQGNTLLFTLPFPEYKKLSDLTLRELLRSYIQISNDKLPYETTLEEREDILEEIKLTIEQKYNIFLNIIDGHINLSNVNGDINNLLDK